jgi:hypothetical protein
VFNKNVDILVLNQLRKLLVKNKKPVSKLEYTRNNYDNHGNLIKESLPTLTTDFCEIGLCGSEIYFVFIIRSKLFSKSLFNLLKSRSGMKIYGFINFNRTLYPTKNFSFIEFIERTREEKYLQVQFSYKNIAAPDLLEKYCRLVKIFEKKKYMVVNQIEINLVKER